MFQCDGVALDLSTGASLEGIAILNIPSIYGGSNLRGVSGRQRKKDLTRLPMLTTKMNETHDVTNVKGTVQGSLCVFAALCVYFLDIGDRMLEVVGLESAMAVGQIKAGLRASGTRLAQCSTVIIRLVRSSYM